jgi:hypothetical protein
MNEKGRSRARTNAKTSRPKLPGLGMDPLNLKNKKLKDEHSGLIHQKRRYQKKQQLNRWFELKRSDDIEEFNNFKNIQSKLNNMFVVEYDSDYIHSGDEDTVEGNEVEKKKI